MIAYTITAPLANWTTYQRSGSGSGTEKKQFTYGEKQNESNSGGHQDQWEGNVGADGGETYTRSGSNNGANGYRDHDQYGNGTNSYSFSEGNTAQGNGAVNWSNQASSAGGFTDNIDGANTYGNSGSNSGSSHKMAYLTAAPKGSNGNAINGLEGPAYKDGTYTAKRYYNFYTSQTTTTQSVEYNGYRVVTTTLKLAKVGTTTTQSIGSSTITLPTTTNAKSWTESTETYTKTTLTNTVVTTSTAINSYWKKTSHTIYILTVNETVAFLKNDAPLNSTNGGPTDTKAFDTFIGPTTYTHTRNAGSFMAVPVLDDSVDTSPTQEEGSYLTETYYGIEGKDATKTYYYLGWPGFPLKSVTLNVMTSTTATTETHIAYSPAKPNWGELPTTERAAWTHITKSYDFNGYKFTHFSITSTTEAYAPAASYPIPVIIQGVEYQGIGFPVIFRSGADSGSDTNTEADENGNITFSLEGGNGGAGAQAGNYYIEYVNYSAYKNNDFAVNACLKNYLAWGTLGGTTAVPKQSISINGIVSSESVYWPIVSISAGVATPKPFVSVSQKPETSKTSSTAALKTEITKYRIWGDEFFKLTSSQNSSTGTSGSTTTPIVAGGAAITLFTFDDNKFPVYRLAGGWISVPNMYIVGGFAQVGESTAVIPAGKYANTTLSDYTTYKGSSINNSYFEIKNDRSFLCRVRNHNDDY